MKIKEEDVKAIKAIYEEYDGGELEDKEAFFMIKDILREKYNCDELSEAIQRGLDMYNEGSSGMLLELCDFVKKYK